MRLFSASLAVPLAIAALLTSAAIAALPASAAEAPAAVSPVQEQLQLQYAGIANALYAHDSETLKTLLTADFVSIAKDGGRKTLADLLHALDTAPPRFQRPTRTTIQAVQVSGDTATVRESYDVAIIGPASGGKGHVYGDVAQSTDVWKREGERWKLASMTVTDSQATVDGAPMAAARPAAATRPATHK